MKLNDLIIVRGGGDLATGVIHRLFSAGLCVLVLETDRPSAIRRQVSLCDAVYEGQAEVEGAVAVRVDGVEEMERVWNEGRIPLMVDPEGKMIRRLKPSVVVDAILAKRNMGTCRSMAPLTIGMGPGFTAGEDVDAVIETMRGHDLGRVIRRGTALANTGVPGMVGGYAAERVIHAPCAGTFHIVKDIGSFVEREEVIGEIDCGDHVCPVPATIPGLLRGIIREGYEVPKGFKIADIDPRREEYQNCFTISDKARCIAGSVLELVCRFLLTGEK